MNDMIIFTLITRTNVQNRNNINIANYDFQGTRQHNIRQKMEKRLDWITQYPRT